MLGGALHIYPVHKYTNHIGTPYSPLESLNAAYTYVCRMCGRKLEIRKMPQETFLYEGLGNRRILERDPKKREYLDYEKV